MKLSIRSKLLLGFALVLALSFFVQAVLFRMVEDYVFLQVKDFHREKAAAASNEVNDFITTTHLRLLYIGQVYAQAQTNNDSERLTVLTDLTLQELEYIDQLTFLSTAGRELLKRDRFRQTPDESLSFEIPTSPFRSAANGESDVSKVFFLEENEAAKMNVFTPILSPDKKVIGVVKAQIDLSHLTEVVSRVQIGDSGLAYIVDDEGRLIAHPNQQLVLASPNYSNRPLLNTYLFGDTRGLTSQDYFYNNQDGQRVFAQATTLPDTGWVMIVEQPDIEAFSFLNISRTFFYSTAAGSALVLIVISLFLSRNLTNPIVKLRELTTALSQHKNETNVNIKSGDEIEALANSFNSMAFQIKQREYSLENEKQQMERLLQSMTEGVIAINGLGNILVFNQAASAITGLAERDALGKNIDQVLQFFDGIERVKLKEFPNLADSRKDVFREKGLSLYTLKGRISVSVKVAPVAFDAPGGNGWIFTLQDITMTQKLEEMKLDFVAMAAHELRTPLTAIKGYLDILESEIVDRLNDQEKVFLNRTVVSANELSSLVENLLNVSRIEKGNLNLELNAVSIEELIQQIVNGSNDLAKEKGVILKTKLPEQRLSLAYLDRFRIYEVINNLVSNAINYTASGGSVTLSAEERDGQIIVRVADTGTGIPADALPHLFTKFYRVSHTLEQGSKGTGLGLFIAKAIVSAHKGKIWVESKQGQGSVFSFSIPIDGREQK